MSKRATAFFNQINYSSANEDGATERKALAPHLGGGRAICISGSGSRALELLIDSPERLVSIDFNPTQNFLLELKVAAIKRMEHEDFLAFIGVTSSDHRLADFQKLKSDLHANTRAFWENKSRLIQSGIAYCGSWEFYLRQMAATVGLLRGSLVNDLLNTESLEAQVELWDSRWKNLTWNLSLKMLGTRALWKYIIREPGIDRIPRTLRISDTIGDRLDRAAHHVHFRNCAFAWLIFRGKYNASQALPCHLEKENYATIRSNLDALEIRTGSIDEYLTQTTDSFSAFSVSDFGSYAPPEVYRNTWQSIYRSAAKTGASVCEREFLVPQSPESIEGLSINRDRKLEEQLAKEDRSFVYDFVIARVGS